MRLLRRADVGGDRWQLAHRTVQVEQAVGAEAVHLSVADTEIEVDEELAVIGRLPVADDLRVDAHEHRVGAHDGQGDVMVDSGCHFGFKNVAPCGAEEVHRRLFVEGRRVGDVDHHVGASERFGETLPGDGVDAGARSSRDCLMAFLL